MNKKSQAQIITTVLIILLVFAAIVIVWQVVGGTIEKGGKQIEAQSGCIGVSMEISGVTMPSCSAKTSAGTDCIDEISCEAKPKSDTKCGGDWNKGSITVRRGQGSTETKVTGYKLFRNGAQEGSDKKVDLVPLSTNTYNIISSDLVDTDELSVAAIVGNTVCAASATKQAKEF